jgi:GNAT superfamily N-acetyltransferase
LLLPSVDLEVMPLADEYLDAAARLLADRHRRDRLPEPDLPARFEEHGAARALLKELTAWPVTTGMIAFRGQRPVGFLLGGSLLTPPASRHAFFLPARSGYVPFAGHAVAADEGPHEIYGALYGALSADWVARDDLCHYVQIAAADRAALAAWHALGFGDDLVTALRDTGPLPWTARDAEIRRATPDDLDVVTRLVLALYRYHAEPPMYLPYLREAEAHQREHERRLLGDPACSHWLAYRAGHALGVLSFQPPSPRTPPMIVPAECVYLLDGYLDPAARGTGLGVALLARGLEWACAAGYRRCLLHFHAANVVARRFWLDCGFRPVKHRLSRRIDERVARHVTASRRST